MGRDGSRTIRLIERDEPVFDARALFLLQFAFFVKTFFIDLPESLRFVQTAFLVFCPLPHGHGALRPASSSLRIRNAKAIFACRPTSGQPGSTSGSPLVWAQKYPVHHQSFCLSWRITRWLLFVTTTVMSASLRAESLTNFGWRS
jgi:hypothetical protein